MAKELSEEERWDKYLHERLLGINKFTSGTVDTIQLTPTTKQRSRWSLHTWPSMSSPVYQKVVAVAAAVTLSIPILRPAVSLFQDYIDEVRVTADLVSDRIFGYPEHTVTKSKIVLKDVEKQVEVPVEVSHSEELGKQGINNRGDFAPDHQLVLQIAQQIQDIVDNSGEIISLTVQGISSDEWGNPTSSLGIENPGNLELAARRAGLMQEALHDELTTRGLGHLNISIEAKEAVLSSADLELINRYALQNDGGSVGSLLNEYASNPDSLPPDIKDFLDISLGQKRGINISVDYISKEMTTEKRTIVVPEKVVEFRNVKEPYDIVPNDPVHDYTPGPFIWLIPPPLPYLKRRKEEYVELQEEVVQEPLEERVEFKLYPEALHDGQLDQHAWALTRKYQWLMRNDHVKHSLNYSYMDAQGEQQTLRAIFVDHKPTDADIDTVTKLFDDISLMNDGKIPEQLGMIAIYPSRSTGTLHNAPKKIGLGVDEQYESAVLGVATPTISLVELHVDLDLAQLSQLERDQFAWTLAHEVGGHFTDVKPGPVKIHQIKDKPNAYYAVSSWTDKGYDMVVELQRQPRGKGTWLIHVPCQDPQTGAFSYEKISVDKLPENYAIWGSLFRNGPNTRYSTTDPAELYAEIAGQVITGQHVPFGEMSIPVSIPTSVLDEHLGYREDPVLYDTFAKSVGANVGSLPHTQGLRWPRRHVREPIISSEPAALDPFMEALSTKAKATPLPKDDELISVIGVIRETQIHQSIQPHAVNPPSLGR